MLICVLRLYRGFRFQSCSHGEEKKTTYIKTFFLLVCQLRLGPRTYKLEMTIAGTENEKMVALGPSAAKGIRVEKRQNVALRKDYNQNRNRFLILLHEHKATERETWQRVAKP